MSALTTSVEPSAEGEAQAEVSGARIPGRSRVLAGMGASYVQSGVSVIAGLITTRYFIQYLGDTEFGLWMTAWSIINYTRIASNSMSVVGLTKATESFSRGDDDGAGRVLVTSCSIGMLFAGVATGFVVLLALVPTRWAGFLEQFRSESPDAIPMLLILMFGCLAAQPSDMYRLAVRTLQRVDIEQGYSAILRVLQLILGIGVLMLGGGVVALAVVTSACQVGIGIPFWRSVRQLAPNLRLVPSRFDAELARRIVAPSFQLCIVAMSGSLIWGTDNIVISTFLGAAAVTPFAVAMQLLNFSNVILYTFVNAMTPTVTSLHALGNIERLRSVLLTSVKFGMAMATLMGVGYVAFGEEFLRLWLGADHVVARPVLLVLLLVFSIKMFAEIFVLVVLGTLNHRTYSLVILAEGILNLTLSLTLVGRIGILGVAVGTLIAQAACTGWYLPVLGLRIAHCTFRELLRRSLLPVVPATVVALAVAWLYHLIPLPSSWIHLAIGSCAIALAHVATFALMGMGPEGREVVGAMLRRRKLS